jgi:hypothetical protein
MATTRIRVRSRRGEGYLVLTVVMLGLAIILMSLALDGLGMAVAYRRAVGLATAGAQAGAGALAVFDGGAPALSGDACAVAVETVQASAGQNASGESFSAQCGQTAGDLVVTVSLRPLRFFGGPLALAVQRVTATARAAPRYGINFEE